MANQKQRKRREKENRHDYDLVEIDDDGNETVIRASELREAAGPPARVRKGDGASTSSGSTRGRGRGEPKPPSWRRVFKRVAIFGPLFIVVLLLLGGNKMSYQGVVIQTLILMIFFVPFSYFMDRFVWRSYQKRLAKGSKR